MFVSMVNEFFAAGFVMASIPNIGPDFSGPGSAALVKIASWILGGGLLVSFIALIVSIALIAGKGFGSSAVHKFAASNIGWVFLAVAALGSISGIFQLAVGFNLGL